MEWQNLKEKNSGRNYYFYFSEILKHYLILKFLKTIEPQSGGRNVEAGILCNHSITIISLRIVYKILLLTFKCIYGLAPTYLSDLISIKSNSLYNLRSTGKLLLNHPKGKMLTTLGARSFSAAAPKLWNELPVELRQATSLNSFKSRLKTYLFKKYFYSL